MSTLKRDVVFADDKKWTKREERDQLRQTYSRNGASRHPNCDCGALIRIGSGQICTRCQCLHCSRCTWRTPVGPVCEGCISIVEQEQMQYKRWRKGA